MLNIKQARAETAQQIKDAASQFARVLIAALTLAAAALLVAAAALMR